MKINRFELGMLRVPLKTPFKTALRTVDAAEDVVLRIHTDTGHIGHGSAPATAVITGDTHGGIVAAVRTCIAPRLLGQEVADLNRLCTLVHTAMEHNTSAKAAVEIALYDLWAQLHGAPLYQLLGGGEPMISTDITISVDAIDTMVADALAAIDRGYTALKIKVGKDITLDVERVKAIHAAVQGRATLRLDANQGWSAKQAVQAMHALEQAGVVLELLEQPVKAHDLAGLKYVTERVATPVMADESAFNPRQVVDLIRDRAADIINIKLMKAGGLSNALRIADIAAVHDVPCMIGCMIESSISVAAAAHLAVARAGVVTKVDLDGPALCRFDPVSGNVRFDEAVIRIGDAPGLGITGMRGLKPLQ